MTTRRERQRREAREAKKDKLWERVTTTAPEVRRHLTRPEVAALVWAWTRNNRQWRQLDFTREFDAAGARVRTHSFPIKRPSVSYYDGFNTATLLRMADKGLLTHKAYSGEGYLLTNKGCEWARRLHEILDESAS